MNSFTDCMDALRALSADASLDPASRFLAAARVIRHYLEQAGSNIRERQSDDAVTYFDFGAALQART